MLLAYERPLCARSGHSSFGEYCDRGVTAKKFAPSIYSAMKRYLDTIEEHFLREARSEILMSIAYGSLREKVASSRFDLWALFRFVPTLEAVCAALPLKDQSLKFAFVVPSFAR